VSAEARAGIPGGRLVAGPTAFGDDWGRFWRLATTLALTEFKMRFFGSLLGYVWQLMRPLMLFGVIYVVFVEVLGVGGDEPYFGAALLLGLVVFQFFSDATSMSVQSLVVRENLVRKIDFPRMAVPVSALIEALMNLGLNLLPVLLFLVIAGGSISAGWLALPLILLLAIVFTAGCCMLLSALYVRYRDVQPIWDVVMQALFYATPILYSLSIVIDKVGLGAARAMLVSPLASAIQQARHAVISPEYDTPSQIFASDAALLLPVGLALATFAIGLLVFVRAAPRVAEEL
jgi:ABC-2 type transport system permease protein